MPRVPTTTRFDVWTRGARRRGGGTGCHESRVANSASTWSRSRSRKASAGHGPCDDHALDFVRALVDLGDLRVAHHALDRVVVHVAVAAQYLHGLDGHGHRRVGREQL